MSRIKKENILMREKKISKRDECHTYEGAYSYFKERVAEMDKANDFSGYVHHQNIVKKTGPMVVRITLHSMPLYWDTVKTGKIKTVYHADGETVRYEMDEVIGMTDYKVESEEEGIELVKALASEEDPYFTEMLQKASEALQKVDTEELPDINEYAKNSFNASEWVKTFGEWHKQDDISPSTGSKVYSKKKTNKMNQFKQAARRKLGYARAAKSVAA